LQRALDAGLEALFGRKPPRTDTGDDSTAGQRRADAVQWIAQRALGANLNEDAVAPRYTVVLHVDEAVLRERSQEGHALLDGVRVSAETSRRLACDPQQVSMVKAVTGNARGRALSPAMRHALEHRDHGCRFPGCGLRFCDAHHIVHWADGGATRLDNLALLCRRHHRMIHEGGFRIERDNVGALHFYRPDGRELAAVPPAPVLPPSPTACLRRAHEEQKLSIDPWTATTRWNGERLDLDWAIQTLWRPPPATTVSAPTESATGAGIAFAQVADSCSSRGV
jgi:hypothetical protein